MRPGRAHALRVLEHVGDRREPALARAAQGLLLQGRDASVLVARSRVLVDGLAGVDEVALDAVHHGHAAVEDLAADRAIQELHLGAEHLRHLGHDHAGSAGHQAVRDRAHERVRSDPGEGVRAAALDPDSAAGSADAPCAPEAAGIRGELPRQGAGTPPPRPRPPAPPGTPRVRGRWDPRPRERTRRGCTRSPGPQPARPPALGWWTKSASTRWVRRRSSPNCPQPWGWLRAWAAVTPGGRSRSSSAASRSARRFTHETVGTIQSSLRMPTWPSGRS